MSRTHRLLLSKEKLTVSVIYPLILKIFKKNLFFLANLIIWVVWFLLVLNRMHVLYIPGYEALMKYVICNFFHSIVHHYIFLMASFIMKNILSLMWSHYFSFQLLPLLLMTDLFELLVFWKAILYQLFHLLLSSPILNKRHKLTEWIQKQDPYICCLQKAHFSPRDSHRLKVRGWKKIFHANGNPKKTRLTIFISEKK